MNKAIIFAIGLLSTAALIPAHAQTYQWKDGSGKTIISDAPPAGSKPAPKNPGPQAPAYGYATPETKKETAQQNSVSDKEQAFQKRQQEAREKAEKDAREATLAQSKKDNCERARRNLTLLQSDRPVSQLDAKGNPVVMDNKARQQEIERTRSIAEESCK